MSTGELFEVFREEATEAIARVQRLLMELETSAPGEELGPKIQEIFRHAHTLKGSASAVQRQDIAEVAHQLESCLDQVRRNLLSPGKALTDASFAAIDLLTVALERELNREEIVRVSKTLENLRRTAHPPPAAAPSAAEAAEKPDDKTPLPAAKKKIAAKQSAEEASSAFFQSLASLGREDLQDKGASAAEAADRLAKSARVTKSKRLSRVVAAIHSALLAASQKDGVKGALLEAALMAADFIQSDLGAGASDEEADAVLAVIESAQAAQAKVPVAPPPMPAEGFGPASSHSEQLKAPPHAAAPDPNRHSSPSMQSIAASVRIPVSLLDAILYRLDELVAVRLRIDHQRRQVEEVQETIEQMLTKIRLGTTHATAGVGSVAVEEVKRRVEYVRRDLNTEVHTLGILAHSLQEDVKEVRMVPVGPLLDPFRRTVRELATSLGKEAVLEITGEDVRVDKRLLELMRDPLLHLLRNSVDHGMEKPAEREAAGKPPRGTIRINAESRESQILLEIRDDGRGIDTENVRRTAIERGLVD
ncbi:MAG: Hpt domain-containing protein, partial [Myxococcaceae bacterium]